MKRALKGVRQRAFQICLAALLVSLALGAWVYGNEPWVTEVTLVRPAVARGDDSSEGTQRVLLDSGAEALIALLSSQITAIEIAGGTAQAAGRNKAAYHPVPRFRRGADTLTIVVSAMTRKGATDLANAYAEAAVNLSAELYRSETRRMRENLAEQLAAVDRDLEKANRELAAAALRDDGTAARAGLTNILQEIETLDRKAAEFLDQREALGRRLAALGREIVRFTPALVNAHEALDQALLRYTKEHPRVKELQAGLAALESELETRGASTNLDVSGWANPSASALQLQMVDLRARQEEAERQLAATQARRDKLMNDLHQVPSRETQWVQLLSRCQALQKVRFSLAARGQEVQSPAAFGPQSWRILQTVTEADATAPKRLRIALEQALGAGTLALLAGALAVGWREARRTSIQSPDDLAEATGLPVLAVLGDLASMNSEEQEQWAYRTFTALKAQITHGQRQPLFCGLISARPGEGCTTWIKLLAAAARRQGFRVVTVEAPLPARAIGFQTPGPGPSEPNELLPALIQTGALQQGEAADHVQLPSWEWNIEQCKRWRSVVEQCTATDYLVVLTKLPPASVKESIMLAQEMPNLLWLGARAMADSQETQSHVALLRRVQCRLAGAVFNRAAGDVRAWSTASAILWAGICLGAFSNGLTAQDTAPPPPATPTAVLVAPETLSAPLSTPVLADWQKRLTLGPGDVINVSLYGQTDTLRSGLILGPDGRINYLEARDFMATGLTIDEMRLKLEEVLGKYHRSPKVIVTPVSFQSKKYYLLGNVIQKGVFPLDRPITIIEAVARSRGFITSQEGRNALVQADLQRAFMVRRTGENSFARITVDFEGLFQNGDLSQNLILAPDDYLFFPPLGLREVFVLGQVRQPGPVPLTLDLTVEGAIIARGGFSDRAWKSRVLVVSGSLKKPQGRIVDVIGAMKGKRPGSVLANRDIIYVSERPFARVEELIESAVNNFVYAFVVGTTGRFTPPIFSEPIIP